MIRSVSMGAHAARAEGTLVPVARFEKALYARDAIGRIVCLVPIDGDDGPLHARIADPWPDGAFALAPAPIWAPPAPPAWAKDALAAGIARARARRPARLPHPANAAYAAGIAALTAWRCGEAPIGVCGALIGLGVGLTPSGDDALGGAAIALRAFGERDAADTLAAFLRATAPGRTSDIAGAFLDAACDGQGTGGFHRALAALVGDGDFAALDTMGHSSGWDAMDGALAVLDVIVSR